MTRRTRDDILAVALLAAVIGAAYWGTWRPGHDWGGDFSQYINHARNIALGRPYLETRYEVTLPQAASQMPASYPPGFPLLLAPIYQRYGLNLAPMKVAAQVLFLLAALAYYLVGRLRGLRPAAAAIAAGSFALSGLVLSMKDLILSDSAYLVFAGLTLSALLLIERYKWDERRPITAGLLVAMLMLCAYGTRAIGGALAVAFVLHELTVKRRIRTFAVIVLGGFFAGVVALSITLYDSRTYGTEFLILPKVYLQNAMFYLRAPAALWTGAPAAVRSLLFVLTAVVVTGQWVRRMVTRPTVVEFQDLVLVCTLIVLTAGNSARYLLPFFAMYFIYFFEGIEWLRVRLPVGAGLAVAAGALLIIGTIFNIRGAVPGAFRAGVEQPAFTELAGFVRQNVDPDALVVSWNPRVLALYTDRRSAWYPRTADDAAFDSYLERTGASFVLVYLAGEEDARWVVPHIARQPAHFLAIFRNADFVLYRNTSSASN